MKKIYKYPTGATVPDGAIYLSILTQKINSKGTQRLIEEWLVWHYFLVEANE